MKVITMPRSRPFVAVVIAVCVAGISNWTGLAQSNETKPLDYVIALIAQGRADGRLGTARKTRPVDARKAKPGEIIVTTIKGEGKETQSRPAVEGDWVVRNRCPATGDEEYLVAAGKFAERYRSAGSATTQDGWQAFVPQGKPLRFLTLRAVEAPFTFTAPWNEAMIARPGDALVQDPENERDVYRVARASFDCTYEVVTPVAK